MKPCGGLGPDPRVLGLAIVSKPSLGQFPRSLHVRRNQIARVQPVAPSRLRGIAPNHLTALKPQRRLNIAVQV